VKKLSLKDIKSIINEVMASIVDEDVIFREPTGIPGIQPANSNLRDLGNSSSLSSMISDRELANSIADTSDIEDEESSCKSSCACSSCQKNNSEYDDDIEDIVISLKSLTIPEIDI